MPCPALLLTFEACHDAALIVDVKGEILHLNSAAQKLYDWGSRPDDSVSRRNVGSFFTVGPPLSVQGDGDGGINDPLMYGAGGAVSDAIDFLEGQIGAAPAANNRTSSCDASATSSVWAAVVRELTTRHESRTATGFRADGSSFPASLNLLKLDDSFCLEGALREPSGDPADASTYICAFVRDIESEGRATVLERRVEELEWENARLRRTNDATVEASGDSIIVIDEDGIIQYLDKNAQSKFGFSEGELLGRNVSALMGGEHSNKHDGYIRRYMTTGKKRVIGRRRELEAMKKDGTRFPMELSVAEIETDPEEKCLFVGMISDSSSKKRAFSMLERSERIRQGILDASFDAIFSISQMGIILTANRAATSMFGWMTEEMVGQNIDMVVKQSRQHSSWGGKRYGKHRYDRHFRGADSGGPVNSGGSYGPASTCTLSTNSSNISTFEEVLGDFLSSDDGSPDSVKREMFGRRMDGTDFPIELGLARIKQSATVGDASMQGAPDERIFCGFVRDLTRQKEAERELKAKSKVNTGIIKAAFDAMFIIDDQGTIEMVNDAAVAQFGWKRESFVGNNISMICGAEHAKNHDKYIERYIRTGEKRVMNKKRELQARRKDGNEFPIELGLAEVRTEGADGPEGKPKRRFCGFVRDLTAEKTAQIELRRKQNMASGIVEAAFDPLFFINESGKILLVNEAAVEQFGWSREEFLGRNISLICGGGRAPHHDSYIKRYLKTGEKRVMNCQRELLARRKDETEFPIELGLTEVSTEDGEERQFCGFIRDLTRQKADEAELRRKQDITLGIVEASFDAMFSIDDQGIIQMVNGAAIEQFGWSKDEMLGQNVSMIVGGSHSENHDQYIQRYLETGERRVMGKKRELQARRKDGTVFFIELGLVEVETADCSHGRMFCGFIKDLTDQKAAEAELLWKQRLTEGIIEASFDAMFSIDDRGTIQMVNGAAVRLFGWTKEQMVGQNVSLIVGGSHSENHDQYIRHYLHTGERRVMGKKRELQARSMEGVEFPIELGLTEVGSEKGEVRRFCGFIRDLREQKKLEAQLHDIQSGNEAVAAR